MQKTLINVFFFMVAYAFAKGKIVQLPTKNYEPQRINVPLNIPNIWGGNASAPPGGVLGGCSGYLFGYSGLDGKTSETDNFVALVEGVNYSSFDLRFCGLKGKSRVLAIETVPKKEQALQIATNDIIFMGNSGGDNNDDMLITYASWNIMVGNGVTHAELKDSSVVNGCFVSTTDNAFASKDNNMVVLCTMQQNQSPLVSFSLVYTVNSTIDNTIEIAKDSLKLNLITIANHKLAQYEAESSLPSVKHGREKLRNKAISIMRVNSLTAEGLIKQRWSTPDRMPHTWMWLWDSCFHSLAMNLLEDIPTNVHNNKFGVSSTIKNNLTGIDVSWEYLKSVLDAASPDGGIAIQRTPETAGRKKVDQTQPPLLSWSVWQNYRAAINSCSSNGSKDLCTVEALNRLKYAFPRLEGYLKWDIRERTDPSKQTNLLSWVKGTESGMDNSQRFDANVTNPGNVRSMLAVDFSTFFALDASNLALIAKALGNTTAFSTWSNLSSKMSSEIHNLLWDDKNKMYMDRHAGAGDNETKFSIVKSVAHFLPLLLDDFPAKERMAMILSSLESRTLFNAAVAVPSVSLDTISFSTDMWRGPMWINTNYFIYLGLKKYGATEAAQNILEATINCVEEWYNKTGVFYEFYDSKGLEDPRVLLRKGARTGGVRDYHWTAALILKMLSEENNI